MNELDTKIMEIGIVPVVKLNHPERDAVALASALCDGGVPVAEITFRAAGADMAIHTMKESYPGMIVGAGTVTTKEHIDLVIRAGGDFIVTPGYDQELVDYAKKFEDTDTGDSRTVNIGVQMSREQFEAVIGASPAMA